MDIDKRVEFHMARLGRLQGMRSNFENLWQDIVDYLMPWKAGITNSDQFPGESKTGKIYDSTPIYALNILSAGLMGHLTSEATPWFQLAVKDQGMSEVDEVRDWLLDSTGRMIGVLSRSNFYTVIQEFYEDLCGFNTAHMYSAEDADDTVRFYSFPVREVFIAENQRGVVDTHYRKYMDTLRNVAEEFGFNSMSKDSRDVLEKTPDVEIEICHAVYPRQDFNPALMGAVNLPFASLYYETKNKHVLLESGYYEDPWHTARWRKSSREHYGRGPGIDSLADIRMLNKQKETDLRAGQKMVEPPLLASSAMEGRIKTYPKAINYYKDGALARDPLKALDLVKGLPFGMEMTNDTREQVRRAFYVDVFLMLANQTGQMTATEVVERVQERLMILGPALGRLHSEALGPMVERTFAIMARAGQFAPPPQDLMDQKLDIEYVSPLAKALKAMEGEALRMALQMSGPFIQLQPDAADVFDADKAIRHAFTLYGAPSEMLRDDEDVAQIRQQRQMQQQLMAGVGLAQQGADIGKTMAEAKKAGAE